MIHNNLPILEYWEIALILFAVFIFLWMLSGIFINKFRSQEYFNWLMDGFSVVGKVDRIKKTGTSQMGPVFSVFNLNAPFKKIEVHMQLESRENFFLWLLGRYRGDFDQVKFFGYLHNHVGVELIIGRRNDELFLSTIKKDPDLQFQTAAASSNLLIGWQGSVDMNMKLRLQKFLAANGEVVKSLTVRQTEPQVFFCGDISKIQGRYRAVEFLSELLAIFQNNQT